MGHQPFTFKHRHQQRRALGNQLDQWTNIVRNLGLNNLGYLIRCMLKVEMTGVTTAVAFAPDSVFVPTILKRCLV
ncbi:hypothetical protein ABEP90_12400, partial [Cutibacterium acnes]